MKNLVNLTLKHGAEKAEVYFSKRNVEEILFEDNRLKQISGKKLHGLHLKAVKDGKVGSIATSDLEGMADHAKKVVEFSSYGDPLPYEFVSPGASYPDIKTTNEKYFKLSLEELVTEGEEAVKKILDYDKNIKVKIKLQRIKEFKEIYNSHGLELSAGKYYYEGFGSALLVEGDNFVDLGSMLIPKNGEISLNEFADQMIEKMAVSRKTVAMESGKYPVIFSPVAIFQIALTLQGLKGQTVSKNVSPLKGKINTQIFHEKLTLIDDGTLADGYASHMFDDEGTPMQKTILVKNGVLKNFIYNLESATELNVAPTGNGIKAGRSYNNKIEETFTNLIFNPGDTTLDEMIKDIKTGIIVEDISGLMMGNLLQGNIDSDMEMAYKIENGRVVGRVKNGALGTNIYKIFKENLVAIENKLQPGIFDSTVYAPHIMCKDIYVTIA